MNRRDVFQFALRGGVMATVTRLPTEEPAEAAEIDAAPKVEFQKGRLRGGKFEGWEALLAITGKAVRGTVYDPDSLGGPRFTGYRVRGTARGAILDLEFFELEDVAFDKPVGGGRGRGKGKKTTTRFEIDGKGLAGKESGTMTSTAVTLPRSRNRPLAGNYRVDLTHNETGEALGQLRLTADRTGKFNLGDIFITDSPNAPDAIAGRFGAGRDGTIYATMGLPKLSPGNLTFDPSEVQILRPMTPNSGIIADNEGVTLFGALLYLCVTTACAPSYTLEVVVLENRGAGVPVPLAGAKVELHLHQIINATRRTDSNGRCDFQQIGPTTYFARVLKHGFDVGTISDFEISGNIEKRIALSPAQHRTIGTGNVIERVAQSDRPIEGVLVTLRDPSDETIYYTATTNQSGRFSIGETSVAEEYILRATKPGYVALETLVTFPSGTPLRFELSTGDSLRFFDSEFENGWQPTILVDPGGGAEVTPRKLDEGGNPGAYRSEEVSGITKQITVAHMKTSAVWDPGTAEISGISFSFDIMYLGGGGSNPSLTAYYLALKQGDDYFVKYAGDALSGPWITVSGGNLRPTDFIPLTGDTPPDFTSDGEEIQFGYAVIKEGGEANNRTGIDNWSVIVEH